MTGYLQQHPEVDAVLTAGASAFDPMLAAIERPIEVFPTPGGPTKQMIDPETLPFKKDRFFCVAVVKNYARVMHFAANSATLARFA